MKNNKIVLNILSELKDNFVGLLTSMGFLSVSLSAATQFVQFVSAVVGLLIGIVTLYYTYQKLKRLR